jgi:hypothetical protein
MFPAFSVCLFGCPSTATEIRARTAKAWSCPEDSVTVTPLFETRNAVRRTSVYCARGCGRERAIAYVYDFVMLRSGGSPAYSYAERYMPYADTCSEFSDELKDH